VASTKLGCDRLETGLALWAGPELSGPTSFVAAEIHLGRGPAGIYDDWPHCNIQVACHTKRQKILFYFKRFRTWPRNYEAGFTAALGANSPKIRRCRRSPNISSPKEPCQGFQWPI
jgi:hypothetical protein